MHETTLIGTFFFQSSVHITKKINGMIKENTEGDVNHHRQINLLTQQFWQSCLMQKSFLSLRIRFCSCSDSSLWLKRAMEHFSTCKVLSDSSQKKRCYLCWKNWLYILRDCRCKHSADPLVLWCCCYWELGFWWSQRAMKHFSSVNLHGFVKNLGLLDDSAWFSL